MTSKPDTAKEAVKENTKSAEPTKQETAAAPNSNKASDANQGNVGTEDVNAPGVNNKSTPGMDSDASSSTSLGTTTARPASNETVAEAAARTNRVDDAPVDATLNNSPDANHSFRHATPGNPYYDPAMSTTADDTGSAESKGAAHDKLKKLANTITEGTPDEHVFFGAGGVTITWGDIKLLIQRGIAE